MSSLIPNVLTTLSLETTSAFGQRSLVLSSKAMNPSSPSVRKLVPDVKKSTRVAVVSDLFEGILLGLVEWNVLCIELCGAKSSLVPNVLKTFSPKASSAFGQRSSVLHWRQ